MARRITHITRIARIHVTARQLGRAYAEAHPEGAKGKVLPGKYVDALIAASNQAADENMQKEQASTKRGRDAFLEAFEEGALEAWREQAGMPKPRPQEAGDIEIASARYFGRWRVQVYRLALAKDQFNFDCIPADNWRELEPDAAALMLAAYGTIETRNGLVCPPDLAGRAHWQTWEARNTQQQGED